MNDREKYCNLDLIIFEKVKKFKYFYFEEKGYSEDDTYDKYSFLSVLFDYYSDNNFLEQKKILKILDSLYVEGNRPMKDIILLGFLEKIYDSKNENKKEVFGIYKGLSSGLREIKKFTY